MDKNRQIFLELSSELTGYSTVDLEGTGLVDDYWKLVEHEVTDQVADQLYVMAATVIGIKNEAKRNHAMHINIVASPTLWPICTALINLWYLGQWSSMSVLWYQYYAHTGVPPKVEPSRTFVPSAAAYTEQLSYRAAGAHPPGAHPTGFGSWGIDPVFGDFTTVKNKR
jgi:hypothetical protein